MSALGLSSCLKTVASFTLFSLKLSFLASMICGGYSFFTEGVCAVKNSLFLNERDQP